MKYTNEQIQKMRDVRIHSLINVPDNGRRQVISCPHGNRDSSPSCWIYPDNGFKCHSCGAYGNNAVDFLVSFDKVDIKEALLELSKYI